MKRSLASELIDAPDFPADQMAKVHRDLERVHGMLGTLSTVERFVSQDTHPVRRVLDVGCGDGTLLRYLRDRMNVDVIGVDSRAVPESDVPIAQLDATRDPLPQADVAVSTLVCHHLTPEQNIAMMRNVGRSCRRLIILDLVRHPLPLCLFTVFICPMIGTVAARDGRLSIRRAYTPAEFELQASEALHGTQGTFSVDVSRWLSRQVLDIRYA